MPLLPWGHCPSMTTHLWKTFTMFSQCSESVPRWFEDGIVKQSMFSPCLAQKSSLSCVSWSQLTFWNPVLSFIFAGNRFRGTISYSWGLKDHIFCPLFFSCNFWCCSWAFWWPFIQPFTFLSDHLILILPRMICHGWKVCWLYLHPTHLLFPCLSADKCWGSLHKLISNGTCGSSIESEDASWTEGNQSRYLWRFRVLFSELEFSLRDPP